MSETIQTSKQFSLSLTDASKGLLVGGIGAILTALYTSFQAGSLTLNWKSIASVAITSLVAYLTKNFFTPSQTVIKQSTPPTN